MDNFDLTHPEPCHTRRFNFLRSLFVDGKFSLQNCGKVDRLREEFDPKYLEDQFRRVCDDFLEAQNVTTPSVSLHFCSVMVYKLNPFFRENREGIKVNVLDFPAKDMAKQVVVVSKRAEAEFHDLGTAREEDGKLTLKITVAQGMYLAMRILGNYIDLKPDDMFLSPDARATFVGELPVAKLATDLNLSKAEGMKMVNFSCVSHIGHYLEGADASCALINILRTTEKMEDHNRRRATIAWLMRPYIERGLIPDLERAVIIEKSSLIDPGELLATLDGLFR